MGLELTEIVIAVEDQFGIKVDDSKPERLRTVGDFYAYIVEEIRKQSVSTCRTLETFLIIRKAIAHVLGISPRDILLDTPLHNLLPGAHRRRCWHQIRSELKWLPNLQLPSSIGKSLVVMSLGCAVVATTWIAFIGLEAEGHLWFLPIAFLFIAMTLTLTLVQLVVLYIFTRPFARTVPSDYETIRSMLLHLYPNTADAQASPLDSEATDEIWRAYVGILARVLSRPVESIRPEHRFVEDLDAG